MRDVVLDESFEVLGSLPGVVAIATGQPELDPYDERGGFDPAFDVRVGRRMSRSRL